MSRGRIGSAVPRRDRSTPAASRLISCAFAHRPPKSAPIPTERRKKQQSHRSPRQAGRGLARSSELLPRPRQAEASQLADAAISGALVVPIAGWLARARNHADADARRHPKLCRTRNGPLAPQQLPSESVPRTPTGPWCTLRTHLERPVVQWCRWCMTAGRKRISVRPNGRRENHDACAYQRRHRRDV